MEKIDKVYENKLRRQAKRLGLFLSKSSGRAWSLDNQLGYRLMESSKGLVIAGERFELTIEDVEKYLEEYENELRY
jgi:hypothetical protein